MKKLMVGLCLLALGTGLALAKGESAEETRKDIERHQAMAAAHEAAAKCLASGREHEVCRKALQAACKGLAIGKYCGMRHEH
ncbi:MAG: hypothetical protein OEY75_06045 [Hylemonella sp.]|nr:hypothetical protein [Hylemonella sp.]MDH5708658.1 hypothetical protein [Hylemonella sp.]